MTLAQVLNYSYASLIKGLWDEHGTGKSAPYANINFNEKLGAKFFALVMIFFSGCWPHAKLLVSALFKSAAKDVQQLSTNDCQRPQPQPQG